MDNNKNRVFKITLLIIPALILIPAILNAATPPTSVYLGSITDGLNAPQNIAIDAEGNIYVTQSASNNIIVYSRAGIKKSIISIPLPISIDISGSSLYVGSKNGFVGVYDLNGNLIKKIWEADPNFHRPVSIAVEGNLIYISDYLGGVIDVVDGSGNLLRQIDVERPMGLDINGGSLYAIDRVLTLDLASGEYMEGAEIKVFDLNGNLLRKFGSYGVGEGLFIRPFDIEVDDSERVYVSDSNATGIQVLDIYGNFVGAVYDEANPISVPKGIALSPDGRLFIVSMQQSAVKIFGIDDYTYMVVSPQSISLKAQKGKPSPTAAITVSNTGVGTLTYTAVAGAGWLILSNSSGSVGGGSSQEIVVSVDVSQLAVGTYSGSVTVSDDSGAKEVVSVSLEVIEPPVLTVTPQSLSFSYLIGGVAPSSQIVTIEISNDLDGTTTWTATSDSGWLSISPSTGSGNSVTISYVSVNVSGLSAGTYTGNIKIDAPNTTGSPANISVTLDIRPSGTIHVTTNLTSASFTITGPQTYTGSGTDWAVTDVPDGTYTINYNNVSGYKTPPSETKALSGGGTIEFYGEYLRLAKNIITSIESGRSTTEVRVFNADGVMAMQFTPYPDVAGGAITASGDINGDGEADIIVGYGLNTNNESIFSVFTKDGLPMTGKVKPFFTKGGVRLSVADLDGDGRAEVIAGAGNNRNAKARLKVYTYNGGGLTETGIDFLAYSSNYGVEVAVGDVDGDGQIEILTLPAGKTPCIVKIWEVENTAGTWTVNLKGEFLASKTFNGRIAGGDLNADGRDEIIVTANDKVMAFNEDGTPYGLEIGVDGKSNVAAGDVNGDGVAEIVLGLNNGNVGIYNSEGIGLNIFRAFNTRYQIRVSLGDLGY
jgi:hypothetical protein